MIERRRAQFELVQFTALFQKEQVELRWQTATELNNAGFDIQRSIDGRSYSNGLLFSNNLMWLEECFGAKNYQVFLS